MLIYLKHIKKIFHFNLNILIFYKISSSRFRLVVRIERCGRSDLSSNLRADKFLY